MIMNKRMKFIKNENGINYYLFTPSAISLYFNDKKKKHQSEPSHRYSITHKYHMFLYLMGGYRILYTEKDEEILSYIIYTRANKKVIFNAGKKDYYTIFLWTYPEHRGKGLATKMANVMLNDLSIDYDNFYKTISKDNLTSMHVAEKSGFFIECDSLKKGIFHTIYKVKQGTQYLYKKEKS